MHKANTEHTAKAIDTKGTIRQRKRTRCRNDGARFSSRNSERTEPHMSTAAILVLDSSNAKIGPVAATYASVSSTCPKSCALRDNGCYAQDGHVGFTVRRLDRVKATALQAARDEATAIESVAHPFGRPLRMHVSGDASITAAVRLLAKAALSWLSKGGGPVWTYTHAWRTVLRVAWGHVSILASCESTKDGAKALARGYAPAVLVDSFPNGAQAFERDGVIWIPCVEQTRGRACVDCRLCWDADGLRDRKHGIAFAAHGGGRKRALTVIQ